MDVGWSREVAWERRPRAAALLAAARNPGRRFDAIVVGEYEWGFTARQFLRVAEQLERHGVRVWLPEADGPVDPADPTHRALVTALGAIAQREVSRTRHRTLAAMRAQAFEQGRFLGGRPPYGYRLVDAGPHPNRAQAAWGKRLQRLDPEPVTAAHVRWMFARRLAGRSLAGIARELNERGVLCPSVGDPERNRNRLGWDVVGANGEGDPGQSALYRSGGVEPEAGDGQYWSFDGRRRVCRVQGGDAPGAGIRGGLRGRPAGPCRACHRRRWATSLPVARAVAVRTLRAADGLTLGARAGRVPLPSRPPQHRVETRGRTGQPLRPRGRDAPRTRRYASRSTTVTRRGPRHHRTPSNSCAQTLWWWRSTAPTRWAVTTRN